jgi:hypothetical protein
VRVLRLTQTLAGTGRYQVEVALEGEGTRRATTVQVPFALGVRDQERVRWYLEDYAHYPADPAPQVAARVERRLAELGRNLFHAVFEGSRDVIRLWDRAEPELADTRIEVATTVEGATAVPWELLRDPSTDTPLVLRAGAFVRAHQGPARLLEPPKEAPDTLRILLVICRPGRERDVPFRSVASQLVRLSPTARAAFQLDVLRPPTFARLGAVLRDAKAQGAPYQVVHFDGHGTWADLSQLATGGAPGRVDPLRYGDRRSGAHGYLLFEQPDDPQNMEFVDGPKLGDLLAETAVSVLMLNACRSAHAELATSPQEATAEAASLDTPDQAVATPAAAAQMQDAHGRVRAYGSLAQEVVDAGVAGVVAMRYVVYVATAAQFVGQLYSSLLAGQELGAAVSRGRKHLADRPVREVGLRPVNLQDWPVPVVYQAGPLTLAPFRAGEQQIVLDPEGAGRERHELEQGVPVGPDVGYFGRDETLLALDRAFDTQQLVLLHAWAGGRQDHHGGGVRPLVPAHRRPGVRRWQRAGVVHLLPAVHSAGPGHRPGRWDLPGVV